MFVGIHRRAEVERLVQLFDRVRAERRPALVVYTAPQGWGKTRIVQEFYRALAAEQPQPPYWPAALPAGVAGTDRKVTVPRRSFTRGPEVEPQWLWLAPVVGRLSDNSPAPALSGLYEQLRRHRHGGNEAGLAASLRVGRTATGEQVPAVIVLDDAHDLDHQTTGAITEVLTTDVPALVIATTWAVPRPAEAPFLEFLDEVRNSMLVTVVNLGSLTADDLVEQLRAEYPGTDPQVCDRLAQRSSGNPYTLSLLLATPLIAGTVVDGRITTPGDDIARIGVRIDQLLAEHWRRLPADTRRVLVTASALGPAFVDDVLSAALRPHGVDSSPDHAVVTSWIRPFGGSPRLFEFVERPRYEIARDDLPNVLSTSDLARLNADALRATTALLAVEPPGMVRRVLLTQHLTLARGCDDADRTAAGTSAMELARIAIAEHRRPAAIDHLTQAQRWFTDAGAHRPLVECAVELASVVQVERRRADGEPIAVLAVELADRHLAPDDELRARARLVLAATRRRRGDTAAYESCGALIDEVSQVVERLERPSPELRGLLWALRLARQTTDGDLLGAAETSADYVAFCDRHFGHLHDRTVDALQDLGYRLHRARPADAVAVRRDVLARRQRQAASTGDLRTTGARIDMVVALLGSGTDTDLDEAERLADEALTTWSRVYGMEGHRTLRARSVRARVWRRRGFVAEAAGDTVTALCRYRAAATETATVLRLRQSPGAPTEQAELALGLQRHGESLAYLRDPAAVLLLDGALRTREVDLREDARFWTTRDCARSLWWAYRRLAMPGDAARAARRYGLDNLDGPAP